MAGGGGGTIVPKELFFNTVISALNSAADSLGLCGFDIKIETSYANHLKDAETVKAQDDILAMLDMPSPHLASLEVTANSLGTQQPIISSVPVEFEWEDGENTDSFSGYARVLPVGYTSYIANITDPEATPTTIEKKYLVYKMTENGRIWMPVIIKVG